MGDCTIELLATGCKLGAREFFGVLLESGKRRCPGRKDPRGIPGNTAAVLREPAREGHLVPIEPV
jgi:hypothetical protein